MNINIFKVIQAGTAILEAIALLQLLNKPVDFKLDNQWYTITKKENLTKSDEKFLAAVGRGSA